MVWPWYIYFLILTPNAQATEANQTSGIVSLDFRLQLKVKVAILLINFCKPEVPKTPPWVQLTSYNLRSQRNILLARLPFYCKRIQFRNCHLEEMPRANYGEMVSCFPNSHMLANPEGLWTLSSWVLLRLHSQSWLLISLAIGSWFNLQVLLLPGRSGVRLKFPTLQSQGWLLCNQPSSLTAFPKVTSLIQQKISVSLSTFRNSKDFGSSEIEQWKKIKYIWKIYFGNLNDQTYSSV